MKSMYTQEIIIALTNLGERQFETEERAFSVISNFLRTHSIPYIVQEFDTTLPRYRHYSLTIDGVNVPALPTGFVSGKIENNHTLLSSLISSQRNLYDTNINFNPLCSVISKSNHYFAPSLAIKRADVQKVVDSSSVKGVIDVERISTTSKTILVGNLRTPKSLVVSHYDSISTGAVDNASGTALALEIVVRKPELLDTTLFAFCGNEELSYDEPIYWGHGYRCLEAEYGDILQAVEQIIVLDSFGHTPPVIFSDIPTMMLSFPVRGIDVLAKKTKVIAGGIDELMQFYHAENDIPANISQDYMDTTKKLVLEILN